MMTSAWPSPNRVRPNHVAWLADRLSDRDWSIMRSVNRLHLVAGPQLQRLHFADSANPTTAGIRRSQALTRLADWRVLMPLPRRIGGISRGSSVSVYALDTAGHRLLRRDAHTQAQPGRIRRPGVPGDRWIAHILAVSELYVALVEAARAGHFILRDFKAEPHAWWPDGLGGLLKPDAHAVVSNGQVDHLWWIEVDRATESLPTVGRKLSTYLDFERRGGQGPRQVMPGILVTVPTNRRAEVVASWIARQPSLAAELLHVTTAESAAIYLKEQLPRFVAVGLTSPR